MAQLLYFGRLGDVIGKLAERLELPASIQTTEQLRVHLDNEKELNGELLEQSVRIAINSELAKEPAPITNDDEIAFMPPVGGG